MGATKFPLVPPPQGGTPQLQQPGQPGPMQEHEFVAGSIANVTQFKWDGVEPPSALYLQRDDIVIISMSSRLANESVTFNFRWLRVPEPQGGQPSDAGRPGGTGAVFDRGIVETRTEVIVNPTPGTILRQTLNFAEGYLLNVGASPNLATFRGQTFARIIVIRGISGVLQTVTCLLADYCTGQNTLGWPYGRALNVIEGPGWKHSVQIPSPVAGADFSLTMLTAQRMRIESLSASFTASATVANRNITIIVDDGANITWQCDVSAAVTAGQTVSVNATGTNQPVGIVTTTLFAVIPPGLILQPGWRIRSSTAGIQAGDQFTAIWMGVEEWQENL